MVVGWKPAGKAKAFLVSEEMINGIGNLQSNGLHKAWGASPSDQSTPQIFKPANVGDSGSRQY